MTSSIGTAITGNDAIGTMTSSTGTTTSMETATSSGGTTTIGIDTIGIMASSIAMGDEELPIRTWTTGHLL